MPSPPQTCTLSTQQSPDCTHWSSQKQLPSDLPPQWLLPSSAAQEPMRSAFPMGPRSVSSPSDAQLDMNIDNPRIATTGRRHLALVIVKHLIWMRAAERMACA